MDTDASSARSMADLNDVDPYPFYERMRAQGPLVWDDGFKGWVVTSYDVCRDVEIREDLYRHPYANASADLVEIKGGRTVTILQGDEHRKMHRLMLGLFIPRTVEEYRTVHVRPIAEMLIERFMRSGRVELTRAFSDQLPPRVMLSLLGIPADDEESVLRVLALHEDVMSWVGMQNRGSALTERARSASRQINAILLPHVRNRRMDPRNDLISRVWSEAPLIIEDMDEAAALAACREMFLAGSDTTVHALANALYVLLTEPKIMDEVRSDPTGTLPAFVEEVLRLYGSVQYRFRVANQDCEIAGTAIRKDEVLVLVNSAANRDPERFEAPNEIRLDRPSLREHLAFNKGPRNCVGAALARAEMIDAIALLLDGLNDLRLDPEAAPPSFRNHYTRSFRPLNVVFSTVDSKMGMVAAA